MFETYLQTLSINEQNVLTTTHQSRNTIDIEKEKMTTTLNDGGLIYTSTTTTSTHTYAPESSSPSLSVLQNQNTQQTPVTSNTIGPSSSSIYTSSISAIGDNQEQSPVIPPEHELLGCGPNNREGIGIQKALDWLREKRDKADYGWENDTHMVILAKEVNKIIK
jgi:hypothetical protein